WGLLGVDGSAGVLCAAGRRAEVLSSRRLPRRLLRHCVELVAHAVARLDERVARGPAVDLLAHLADEDVDGAVAVGLAAAPDALQQLVARDDPPALEGERIQQPELRGRETGALAVDERLDLERVDAELLALDR